MKHLVGILEIHGALACWLINWLTVCLSIFQVIICPPTVIRWGSDSLTQLSSKPNINNFSQMIMDWKGTNVRHLTYPILYVYYFSCRFFCFLWFTPKFMSLDLTISTFCVHPFLYQLQHIRMGPHGWWIGFASNFLLLHPTFLRLHRSLSAQSGSLFH